MTQIEAAAATFSAALNMASPQLASGGVGFSVECVAPDTTVVRYQRQRMEDIGDPRLLEPPLHSGSVQ
jgi:hypothetical protein